MRKPEIARRMAQQTHVSQAEAADRLDRMVHQILRNLRNGKSAPLPGLGRFFQTADGAIQFKREKSGRR